MEPSGDTNYTHLIIILGSTIGGAVLVAAVLIVAIKLLLRCWRRQTRQFVNRQRKLEAEEYERKAEQETDPLRRQHFYRMAEAIIGSRVAPDDAELIEEGTAEKMVGNGTTHFHPPADDTAIIW